MEHAKVTISQMKTSQTSRTIDITSNLSDLEVQVLHYVRKMLCLSTSLALSLIHNRLPLLAYECLTKAYRADLVFFELQPQVYSQLIRWNKRAVLMNTIAYFFLKQGDVPNATYFAQVAQSIIAG